MTFLDPSRGNYFCRNDYLKTLVRIGLSSIVFSLLRVINKSVIAGCPLVTKTRDTQ
jgi:hypothetical protein